MAEFTRHINLSKFITAMRVVEEDISRLSKGDFVRVLWLDASRSVVNVDNLPLPNHSIETRRKDPRIFVCIQKGQTYHDPHLVVADDEIDSPIRTSIDSIPIYLVKRVVKVGSKTPLSAQKAGDARGIAKRLRVGRTIQFRDGSIKHIG